jgi:hypothetical protein
MSLRHPRFVCLIALLVLSGAATVDAGTPLSPSVLATYHMRSGTSGLDHLDVLVLWRGSPNWYLSGGGSQGGSASAGTTWLSTSRHGGIDLEVQLDLKNRTGKVNGMPIDLRTTNVVFVDNIDDGSGGTIVRTMRIQAGVLPRTLGEPHAQLVPILQSSPEFAEFLRCEAGGTRAGMSNVCPRLVKP